MEDKILNMENKQEEETMNESKFKNWLKEKKDAVKAHPVKTALVVVGVAGVTAGVIYLKHKFGVELETEELTEQFVNQAEEVVENMSDVVVENI